MRRLVLWTLGIVALLLLGLAGMGYRTYLARQASGQLRPVGTLVDVGGGRRLHMICIGQGGPTVIFEPSMMGGASSSSAARQELSRHVRVCSYDRMGSGGSGLAPDVISVGMLVADLEQLLAAAHIPPPYILVPASIGGLVGEVFARRHPDHVAGLVFLDAASSIQLDRVAANTGWFTRSAGTGAACLLSLIELRATFCAMARGFDQTMRDVAAAPPLRSDLPMIVLSAGSVGWIQIAASSAPELSGVSTEGTTLKASSQRSSSPSMASRRRSLARGCFQPIRIVGAPERMRESFPGCRGGRAAFASTHKRLQPESQPPLLDRPPAFKAFH